MDEINILPNFPSLDENNLFKSNILLLGRIFFDNPEILDEIVIQKLKISNILQNTKMITVIRVFLLKLNEINQKNPENKNLSKFIKNSKLVNNQSLTNSGRKICFYIIYTILKFISDKEHLIQINPLNTEISTNISQNIKLVLDKQKYNRKITLEKMKKRIRRDHTQYDTPSKTDACKLSYYNLTHFHKSSKESQNNNKSGSVSNFSGTERASSSGTERASSSKSPNASSSGTGHASSSAKNVFSSAKNVFSSRIKNTSSFAKNAASSAFKHASNSAKHIKNTSVPLPIMSVENYEHTKHKPTILPNNPKSGFKRIIELILQKNSNVNTPHNYSQNSKNNTYNNTQISLNNLYRIYKQIMNIITLNNNNNSESLLKSNSKNNNNINKNYDQFYEIFLWDPLLNIFNKNILFLKMIEDKNSNTTKKDSRPRENKKLEEAKVSKAKFIIIQKIGNTKNLDSMDGYELIGLIVNNSSTPEQALQESSVKDTKYTIYIKFDNSFYKYNDNNIQKVNFKIDSGQNIAGNNTMHETSLQIISINYDSISVFLFKKIEISTTDTKASTNARLNEIYQPVPVFTHENPLQKPYDYKYKPLKLIDN